MRGEVDLFIRVEYPILSVGVFGCPDYVTISGVSNFRLSGHVIVRGRP